MIITLEILTLVVVFVAFGISARFDEEEEPVNQVVRQRTRGGDNRRNILYWTEELDSMMPERTQGDDKNGNVVDWTEELESTKPVESMSLMEI